MYIIAINLFGFNEGLLRALCWTLVHSLWQGLLLAILGGVLVLLTRRSRPVLRYNLFSLLFLLFFIGVGITFALEWKGNSGEIASGSLAHAPVVAAVQTTAAGTGLSGDIVLTEKGVKLTDRLATYFNDHAAFIVILWFALFSVNFLRMLANLGHLHRIRHYRTTPASGYWGARIGELALLLGIRRKVALLESVIVRAPMMAGVFKPVILIPLGLLAQLPPDQVEAVLLHELAHIRRGDYFINLLQSFGETLFFFHPGVWWISALIREERENCCDDIALGVVKNKKEFIHALVSFQEYKLTASSRYAVAFPGQGNHLLQRVKRIIYRDNKTLDIREKCFLLVCLVIIGGLTLAFSRSTKQDILPGVVTGKVVYAATSSSVVPVGQIKRTAVITLDRDTSAPPRKRVLVIKQDVQDADSPKKQQDNQTISFMEAERQLDAAQRELDEQQRQLEIKREELYRQKAIIVEDKEMQEKREQLAIILEDKEAQRLDREKAEQDMRLFKTRLGPLRGKVMPDTKARFVTPIINQLMDEKIITDTINISFELDVDGLIVNGQKQANEVGKPFVEQYIKNPKNKIKYSKTSKGNESTSVTEEKN